MFVVTSYNVGRGVNTLPALASTYSSTLRSEGLPVLAEVIEAKTSARLQAYKNGLYLLSNEIDGQWRPAVCTIQDGTALHRRDSNT